MATILIISDRKLSDNTAIERAEKLAILLNDRLHVVSFVNETLNGFGDTPAEKVGKPAIRKTVDARKLELEKLIEAMESPVKIKTTVLWQKDIVDWVIKHESKKKYRFITKTAAHTGYFFYTSTDWRFIRECKNAVLILAAKKWKARNCILSTVDLSSRSSIQKKLNEKAITKSLKLTKKLHDKVHVCFAVPVPRVLLDLDVIDERKYKRKAKKRYMALMMKLVDGRVPAENLHILFGKPDKRIPSLANKLKAEIVVMGTLGRVGVKARFFGNTAEKTLNKLFTDVLTLKP